MKRAGSLKSRFAFFAVVPAMLLSLTFQVISGPASFAATAGTNQCVQNVNTSSGVTVYQDLGFCWIAFRTVGSYTWTPPATITEIDLLVVGGGGGGGSRHAGGGGAGGVINNLGVAINSSDLSITVGAGGGGGAAASAGGNSGSNGANSFVSGGGITTRTAIGGGGGGYGADTNSGGSGAGGGSSGAGGSATAGQGFNGSAGLTDAVNYWVGGGGGGAGAVGGPSSSTKGGNGGAGTEITWMNSNAWANLGVTVADTQKFYIGGGGGGGTDRNTITAGNGGLGGGGYGATGTGDATNGSANTGGGGGGSGISGVSTGSKKGGDGGSGVVLIRYTIAKAFFKASDYTSGSTTWSNAITGGTSGTAPSGGMVKGGALISAVTFAGKESSNSDQITSTIGSLTGRDTVTVEMWIKLKDSGSAQNASGSMLFSWGTSNFNIYHYSDQIGFNTFNNQLYGIDSSSYNNTWTHLVFVMTDTGPWSTLKIYANGVLQNSTCRVNVNNCTASQVRTIDTNGNFILMDNVYSANTWNAKADLGLLRVYENELTSARVASLYSATQPDYTLPAQLLGNPTLSGNPLKGKSITISVTTYVPGRVTFSANGKRIAGCIAKATSGSAPNYSSTCSWKPATIGRQELVATVSSSDNSFDATRSAALVIYATKRTDKR